VRKFAKQTYPAYFVFCAKFLLKFKLNLVLLKNKVYSVLFERVPRRAPPPQDAAQERP
jgi:hypothetical protein